MPNRAFVPLPVAERLRAYAGSRLQRRLFVWFALTVLLTAAAAAGATWVALRLLHPDLARGPERQRRVVVQRLVQAWADPERRLAVVRDLQEQFGDGVHLRDAWGHDLVSIGGPCDYGPPTLPILTGDRVLGHLEVCGPRFPPRPRLWIGLLAGVSALWIACGFIARRLARPLVEVARVAEQISRGQFDVKIARAVGHGHHRDEVAVVGEVLRDMAQRIDHQLREQRELLAAVSHELRTPLAHLRLLGDTYRDRPDLGPAGIQLIEQAEREVSDLDDLVGQLLANARLEFREIQRRDVAVVELCVQLLERKGLDPTLLDVEGDDLAVVGDPTLLQRALANLVDNARRHGGGAVALRVRPDGAQVRIEVEDGGPGFAPGQTDQAFKPFYAAGHKAESLGLGLHLVERIIDAHQGHVFARNVREAAPRGAIVGFALPLAGKASV